MSYALVNKWFHVWMITVCMIRYLRFACVLFKLFFLIEYDDCDEVLLIIVLNRLCQRLVAVFCSHSPHAKRLPLAIHFCIDVLMWYLFFCFILPNLSILHLKFYPNRCNSSAWIRYFINILEISYALIHSLSNCIYKIVWIPRYLWIPLVSNSFVGFLICGDANRDNY